jgi:hypothetical protein
VKTPTSTLVRSFSVVAFALGIAMGVSVGCEKKGSSSPEDGEKEGNLCTEYGTCDECIAGQQTKGKSQGEAETECGAAVTGCWTTWEKPVKCGDKEHKQD